MTKVGDPSAIRRAALSYVATERASHEALKAAAGINLETSAFNKFLAGRSQTFGEILKLSEYLIEKEYLAESPFREYYESISDFFSNWGAKNSTNILNSVEGDYVCYQPSTWHRGLVTVSHISIKPLKDSEAKYREVFENQFTGDADHCSMLEIETGSPVRLEHEYFRGCCYVSQGSLNFTLRSKQHGFAKNVICNDMDADFQFMSGYVQKAVQNKIGNYIHMESLYIRRVEDILSINPRIEILEKITDGAALRTIKRPIGLAARGILKS